MSQLFVHNKNTGDYSKHCVWFGVAQKKENIIIGVKDNLRIGLGFLLKTQDIHVVRFYLKPAYCGIIGAEFVLEACKFLHKKKRVPIHINCLSNKAIKQSLLEIGFTEIDDNLMQYSKK